MMAKHIYLRMYNENALRCSYLRTIRVWTNTETIAFNSSFALFRLDVFWKHVIIVDWKWKCKLSCSFRQIFTHFSFMWLLYLPVCLFVLLLLLFVPLYLLVDSTNWQNTIYVLYKVQFQSKFEVWNYNTNHKICVQITKIIYWPNIGCRSSI